VAVLYLDAGQASMLQHIILKDGIELIPGQALVQYGHKAALFMVCIHSSGRMLEWRVDQQTREKMQGNLLARLSLASH
jgi:hypothetical protein